LNFLKDLSPVQTDQIKKNLILKQLSSKEELRAWLYIFFGIDFPQGVVYPTSTHAPIDAMWRIYELIKTGENKNIPRIAMLASRDSGKTLSASAMEVLCMIHFRIPIAHMAAIKQQSAKAIQYVNSFFRKLTPYLEYHGWKKTSDSKTYIEWITDKQESVYLNVVTATIAGANSEHVPLLFVDEIDVISDPRALKESAMIPTVYKGYFPLTIYLSTRKYKGGLMEKTLSDIQKSGGEILRWNILDIAERIPHDIARIDKPKVVRYISDGLPMINFSQKEWDLLPEENRSNYKRFEAYEGIAKHPLLPIMKNTLVDRPQNDTGGLYKPLTAILNNFRALDNDMADAQLLCNKPSSSSLVYPKFDSKLNVLSVNEAIRRLLGEEDCELDSFEYLKNYITNLGIKVVGGGDWGFSDYTALSIIGLLPNGEAWLLDTFVEQYLELDDIVSYCKTLQEEWGVDVWYVDQNYPAYLKTLRKKARMKIPSFNKVVADGIAGLQGKIVDTSNNRKFFIIDTPNNRFVIKAFDEYRWKIDGKGDVIEGKPYHGSDGVSDVMDMLRYPAQNIFIKGASVKFGVTDTKKQQLKPVKSQSLEERKKVVDNANKKLIYNKINELATNDEIKIKIKKNGKIFYG